MDNGLNENKSNEIVKTEIHTTYVRHLARARLGKSGLRLYLILLGVLMTALSVGLLYLVSVLGNVSAMLFMKGNEAAVQATRIVCYAVQGLVAALLLLPLFFGCLQGSLYATFEETPDFRHVFAPFSSPRVYARALVYSLGATWRILLAAVVPTGLIWLVKYAADHWLSKTPFYLLLLLYIFCGLVVAGLLLWLLYMYGRTSLAAYLAWKNPDMNMVGCHRLSAKISRGYRGKIWSFHMFFLGMTVLSLFTLGLLFFLYVLPLWMTSYCLLAEQIVHAENGHVLEV